MSKRRMRLPVVFLVGLVLCLAVVFAVHQSSSAEAPVPKSVMRGNSDDHLRRDVVKTAKRLNEAIQAAADAGIMIGLEIDGGTVIVWIGEPFG